MALTDMEAKNAKPKVKPFKLADGEGLYLLVNPNGSKYWRLKYRFNGKEKLLALGVYPEVPLKGYLMEKGKPESWINGARDLLAEARKQLALGLDPGETRKVQREVAKLSARKCPDDGFEIVARQWFKEFKDTWTDGHAETIISRLERDVFPWLGKRRIGEIEAPDVLDVLRRVQARGALETAHRIRGVCGQVFRYAIATGRAKRDVAADLRGALPQPLVKHHAAITEPAEVAELVRASAGYRGTLVVRSALQLAPLVFLRPGELRHAEWAEFDLEAAEWNVPVERLKLSKGEKAKRKGERHLVPLSRQAVEILKELHPLTGRSRYVFTGGRSYDRCMSENAVLAALRRMGYDSDTMTGHGFRAMVRTILDEVLGVRPDLIEHQLAHAVKDPNGRAYNRTSYLEARREMMQQWADYLDELKGA